MANEQNLKVLTPNEAREYGRKGGIISGHVRKENKKIRSIAEIIAVTPVSKMLLHDKIKLSCDSDNDNDLDVRTAIIFKIAKNALQGDIKAIKLFLELTGDIQKQQSVNIVSVNQQTSLQDHKCL